LKPNSSQTKDQESPLRRFSALELLGVGLQRLTASSDRQKSLGRGRLIYQPRMSAIRHWFRWFLWQLWTQLQPSVLRQWQVLNLQAGKRL